MYEMLKQALLNALERGDISIEEFDRRMHEVIVVENWKRKNLKLETKHNWIKEGF